MTNKLTVGAVAVLIAMLTSMACRKAKPDIYIAQREAMRAFDDSMMIKISSPDYRLAITDRVLDKYEYEWAWRRLWEWPHNVNYTTNSVVYYYTGEKAGIREAREETRCNKIEARWGAMYPDYDDHRQHRWHNVNITVDGVNNVTESGRWWRVIREDLNAMADSLRRIRDAKAWWDWNAAWVYTRDRLFKLDSTMKAIGR